MLGLGYGFFKRNEQLPLKFENDRRRAMALTERRAAASDGRCQNSETNLVLLFTLFVLYLEGGPTKNRVARIKLYRSTM